MKIFRTMICCFAASAMLFASCSDTSTTNPLVDPAKAKPDKTLYGVWRLRDDPEEKAYFHVGRVGGECPDGVMQVVAIGHSADGTLDLTPEGTSGIVLTTEIDEVRCFSFAELPTKTVTDIAAKGWKPETIDKYVFVKYQVRDDELTIWYVDDSVIDKAIKDGAIKGKHGDGEDEGIIIADTTENLRGFVQKKGDSLFVKDPLKFVRVK